MPAYPTAIPPSPPRNARTRLSVRSSRISRKRPAPIARRTAISRVRVRARREKKPRGVGARHQQHGQREDREDHAELPVDVVVLRPHFELRVYGRAAVAIELRIVAFEVLARAPRARCAPARRVAPGFRRALTVSSRSSRSTKKFFCGLVENIRAIASGM